MYKVCGDFKVAVLVAVKLQCVTAAVAVQTAEFKIAVFIRFTTLQCRTVPSEFNFYADRSVRHTIVADNKCAADKTFGEVV